MTNYLSSLIAISMLLFAGRSPRKGEAQLVPLPHGLIEVKALNWRLLPIQIDPYIQQGQLFELRAESMPNLQIIPVYFGDSRRLDPPEQCGVYFLIAGSPQMYVPTIGSGYPSSCVEVTAVGVMDDKGPRPRLIFIYSTASGANDKAFEPVILSWEGEKHAYELDHRQTNWFFDHPGFGDTVPDVRKALRINYPGQKNASPY